MYLFIIAFTVVKSVHGSIFPYTNIVLLRTSCYLLKSPQIAANYKIAK